LSFLLDLPDLLLALGQIDMPWTLPNNKGYNHYIHKQLAWLTFHGTQCADNGTLRYLNAHYLDIDDDDSIPQKLKPKFGLRRNNANGEIIGRHGIRGYQNSLCFVGL
jgi:hypothetical protein